MRRATISLAEIGHSVTVNEGTRGTRRKIWQIDKTLKELELEFK